VDTPRYELDLWQVVKDQFVPRRAAQLCSAIIYFFRTNQWDLVRAGTVRCERL